jgi:hypothetical protein
MFHFRHVGRRVVCLTFDTAPVVPTSSAASAFPNPPLPRDRLFVDQVRSAPLATRGFGLLDPILVDVYERDPRRELSCGRKRVYASLEVAEQVHSLSPTSSELRWGRWK